MDGRFFPVTLLGGRVYVDGFSERGPWDTGRLAFQDEATVEILVTRAGHRKVRSAEELKAVLRESEESSFAVRAWIHEGLEDFARGLWEANRPATVPGQATLPRTTS
jgi:hypothetical protein